MKYQITIRSNEAYGADQITGTTVRELMEMLSELNEDDLIITKDMNNPRGASYGKIYAEVENCTSDEDEE